MLWKIQKYHLPQNLFTADLIRFVSHFKILKLSWTANSLMSRGMETFVEELLPKIRANNPQIEYVLYRTHVNCDPFVVGIYSWNRSRMLRCSWKHEGQILGFIEELSVGGDFRPGRKRGVSTKLPRHQEIWNTESRGHDIYKVLSRWKDDEPDPNAITSATHPHFVYRKMLRKRNQI